MFFLGTQYQVDQLPVKREEAFTQNVVSVKAKVLSQKETQFYLKKDLHSHGYQPIWITIQNDTEKSYLLSEDGVDLPNSSSSQVAMRVSASSIPRSIALKVAGFFFWPFMIPSAIDGILTFHSHLNMRSSFYAKSIKEIDEEVLPHSIVHRVLFVGHDQKIDSFTVYLKESSGKKYLPLPITLNS